MNENIDLTKILKNCPEGTKLYSTIFGEVEFVECNILHQIVVAKEGKYYYFTSEGTFFLGRIKYNLGECVLFPSKEQRDWSKFSAPWCKKEKFDPKTLRPFDKVLISIGYSKNWRCDFFSHIIDEDYEFKYVSLASTNRYCIPYNDDTKHLVGTREEAPEYYRYWENSNMADNIRIDNTSRKTVIRNKRKEGWINLYRVSYGNSFRVEPSTIYTTKEEALNSSYGVSYIDTVRIEWKE